MKATGAITHTPRPRVARPVLITPMPFPSSGSGENDCSAGKSSSGTDAAPRLALPASGIWTVTAQPTVTASRIIADKPSFSPD